MEITLPTDVDIWSIDRFVIFFALLHFWRSFNLLEVMWLRIKCYFSACKRVRSPTMSGIARDGILYFYHITAVACHICVQPTVDYIGLPRTVGVVWVCRRFDHSPFCRRFCVAVLTCRCFDHRPFCVFSPVFSIAPCFACYFCIGIVYFQPSECVGQAVARGSQLQTAVPDGDHW